MVVNQAYEIHQCGVLSFFKKGPQTSAVLQFIYMYMYMNVYINVYICVQRPGHAIGAHIEPGRPGDARRFAHCGYYTVIFACVKRESNDADRRTDSE